MTSSSYIVITMTFVKFVGGSNCRFPSFLQTNETFPPRDWQGHIRASYTVFQFSLVFEEDQMVAMSHDSSVPSRTSTCLDSISNEEFIISEKEQNVSDLPEESETTSRYFCIQFVRRSNDVIQLRKTSGLAKSTDKKLCLNISREPLDEWLIVDRTRLLSNSSKDRFQTAFHCASLQGGFSLRMLGKGERKESCDGSIRDEIRLETNCAVGTDSLRFQFRRTDCIPKQLLLGSVSRRGEGLDGATIRFSCIADWSERQYTFVLLRHDRLLSNVWILRLPTKLISLEGSFTAYMFSDLIALTANQVTNLDTDHLRLDFVRDIRRPVTSLCVDDDVDDVCATLSRDSCLAPSGRAAYTALTCARSCGICNATRPSICRFPADWIGQWADPANNQRITINQSVLKLDSDSGRSEDFHCIQWDTETKYGSDQSAITSNAADVMLVAGYENGCRPRYLCIRVVRKSPSVIYFRFSESRTWPLTAAPADPISCQSFTYDVDSDEADDALRTKHFRLLYVEQKRHAVNCNLPSESYLQNLTAAFSDGDKCDDVTLRESEARTAMSLYFSGCRGSSNSESLPHFFDCIMSTSTAGDPSFVSSTSAGRSSSTPLPMVTFPSQSSSYSDQQADAKQGVNLFDDLNDQPLKHGLPGWELRKSTSDNSQLKMERDYKEHEKADNHSFVDFMLLTRSRSPNDINALLHCWIFTASHLYVVNVSQCDESGRQLIKDGKLSSLVTFHRRPTHTAALQIYPKKIVSQVSLRNNPDNGSHDFFLPVTKSSVQHLSVSRTGLLKRFQPDALLTQSQDNVSRVQTREVSTLEVSEDEALDPNAFIVLAVVFLLVLLYIPCICLGR